MNPFEPILSHVPGLTLAALKSRVERYAGLRLLVLGDLMLDEYIWGEVSRVSPEAPVPVVEARRHSYGLGGAGNVVNNVVALGGSVVVAGLIGSDPQGDILLKELEHAGADTSGILRDTDRPTTSKTRVVAHSQQNSQQIVRIDRESRKKIEGQTVSALLDRALAAIDAVDAVLISDYNKGVLVPALSRPLLAACRDAGKPVIINPKPSNIHCLRGSSLVTINQFEAAHTAMAIPASEWEHGPPSELDTSEIVDGVGRKLRDFLGCDTLFITQGARGLSVFNHDGGHHLPAIPAEVYDGTGAGDTVASVTAMTLASGGSDLEAAVLGNAGGALKVHKLGAVAVSREEMLTLIVEGKIEARGTE